MQITENQAICMLFYKSYTQANIRYCKERLGKLGKDFLVCYLNKNPGQPLLVSKQRIIGDPFNYRRYPKTATSSLRQRSENEEEDSDDSEEDEDQDIIFIDEVDAENEELEADNQEASAHEAENGSNQNSRFLLKRHYDVLKFCDRVFQRSEPKYSELYHTQSSYTVADILEVLKKYSDIFDNTSPLSFLVWCSMNGPKFFKSDTVFLNPTERAALPELTTQTKLMLYKMKDELLGKLATAEY
ncbi:hypothetical protein MBANPS3_006242 [Mucor bainieri]